MNNSRAYWILPDGSIIDIGFHTHISYVIHHPELFNITKEKITELYNQFDEILPVEGKARKIIIIDLLKKRYIRIRQYKNHWSISLSKWEKKSQSSLSKWSQIAMTIPNFGRYADVVISTIDGKKFDYAVEDLNISKQI